VRFAVDVTAKIGRTDDRLDAERPHGIDVAGAGREDAGIVGLPPFADQFLLVGVAKNHEGRGARRIDDVDAHAGECLDLLLVGRNGGLELVDRTATNVEAERDEFYALRQHGKEFVIRSHALRRADDADSASVVAHGNYLVILRPQVRATRTIGR
jgi:hypothetical protein